MDSEQARAVIVAGVDGSADSKEALRWAARQASLTGAEVHAVIAWEVPVTVFVVPGRTEADYQRDARETLDKTVADALGPDPGVPVFTRTIQDRPPAALLDAAEHADLLVIGGHGRGEFRRMHLGSVASYCIHHAPCAVAVVCEARR